MNWEQALADLEERRGKAALGGGQLKIDKQHAHISGQPRALCI